MPTLEWMLYHQDWDFFLVVAGWIPVPNNHVHTHRDPQPPTHPHYAGYRWVFEPEGAHFRIRTANPSPHGFGDMYLTAENTGESELVKVQGRRDGDSQVWKLLEGGVAGAHTIVSQRFPDHALTPFWHAAERTVLTRIAHPDLCHRWRMKEFRG